MILLQIPL